MVIILDPDVARPGQAEATCVLIERLGKLAETCGGIAIRHSRCVTMG